MISRFFGNRKALSGISTLIIFIAVILVAAVAAMVLLQTVSSLQSQALSTGKESKKQVSTNLSIVNVVGYVTDSTNIGYFQVTANLAPGSGKISLDTTYLTYSDGITYKSGVDYNMTEDNSNTIAGALASADINIDSIDSAPADIYSMRWLGENANFDKKTDISAGDAVEIFYRVGTLSINRNVSFQIAPTQSNASVVEFKTPSSFDENYVRLFP